MNRTPQEETFMLHGGYGLLSQFCVGESLCGRALAKQFSQGLVQEALNCHLINQIATNDKSDQYYQITSRGVDVRDH